MPNTVGWWDFTQLWCISLAEKWAIGTRVLEISENVSGQVVLAEG